MYTYFCSSRKSKTRFLTADEVEPTIPPPPTLPPNTKAPYIDIVTSSWSTEWKKIINQEEFSDIVFHLGLKQYHAHRYVLCIASDIMRILLDVGTTVRTEGLSQCSKWTASRLKHLSVDTVNEGKVEGFVSIVTENQ